MARHVINHKWACFQEHRSLPSLEDSKGRRHSMPTTSMDAMDVHQVQDFKGLLRDVDNQVMEVTEATAEAEDHLAEALMVVRRLQAGRRRTLARNRWISTASCLTSS